MEVVEHKGRRRYASCIQCIIPGVTKLQTTNN